MRAGYGAIRAENATRLRENEAPQVSESSEDVLRLIRALPDAQHNYLLDTTTTDEQQARTVSSVFPELKS